MDAEEPNIEKVMSSRPIASRASIFLDYLDLKAQLLAVESKEAIGHLTGLLVLLGTVAVLALCSVLMYGACLLHLIALLFHLAKGWSASICGVTLTVLGTITFLFFCECDFENRSFN